MQLAAGLKRAVRTSTSNCGTAFPARRMGRELRHHLLDFGFLGEEDGRGGVFFDFGQPFRAGACAESTST